VVITVFFILIEDDIRIVYIVKWDIGKMFTVDGKSFNVGSTQVYKMTYFFYRQNLRRWYDRLKIGQKIWSIPYPKATMDDIIQLYMSKPNFEHGEQRDQQEKEFPMKDAKKKTSANG